MKMVHVTINTADLEKSLAFYQDIIGLKIRTDMRQEQNVPIVFLDDGNSGVCIELIENQEQLNNGAGLSIGFHVNDVEAVHGWMWGKGLQPSPMLSPNPHTKFFFVNDPSGIRIQIIS